MEDITRQGKGTLAEHEIAGEGDHQWDAKNAVGKAK